MTQYRMQGYGVSPRVYVRRGNTTVGSMPAKVGMKLTDGSVITSISARPVFVIVHHPKWGRQAFQDHQMVTLDSARKHGWAI